MKFWQDATKEQLANMVQMMIGDVIDNTTPYCLFGCVKSTGGSPFSYTQGAIYFNGEIYDFPAIASIAIADTDVCTITVTNDGTADPLKFTDTVSRNVHNHRDIVLSDAATGTGDFDFSETIFFNNKWKTYAGIDADMSANAGVWELGGTGSVNVRYLKQLGTVTLSFNATLTEQSVSSVAFFEFDLPAEIGTPTLECYGSGRFTNTDFESFEDASNVGTTGVLIIAQTNGKLRIDTDQFRNFYCSGSAQVKFRFSISFPV
jgi:hypothetical protein